MERILNTPAAISNIDQFKKILNLEVSTGKKSEQSNNFSAEQWKSFSDLVKDLELTDKGISILYQEVSSGRVLLPCDRNKKMSR